jgi:transcriptional regulator of acetoin/glycerol metabolism
VEWAAIVARGKLDEAAIERALATHGLRESPEGLAAEAFELREALARHDWNKVHVAQELGVHLATIYRRIKKHRIAAPRGRATPGGSTQATAS